MSRIRLRTVLVLVVVTDSGSGGMSELMKRREPDDKPDKPRSSTPVFFASFFGKAFFFFREALFFRVCIFVLVGVEKAAAACPKASW
jgi:hypothetical protein